MTKSIEIIILTIQRQQSDFVMVKNETHRNKFLKIPVFSLKVLAETPNDDTLETFAILTGGQNKYEVHIGEIGLYFENAAKNSCASEIPLPYPMYDHMAVIVENILVLCGGYTGPKEVMTSNCHRFNKTSHTWTSLANLPVPLTESSLVANGKLFPEK